MMFFSPQSRIIIQQQTLVIKKKPKQKVRDMQDCKKNTRSISFSLSGTT